MSHCLENDTLKIAIDTYGAELSSIYNKKENKEMLWQGDPAFGGRKSKTILLMNGENLKYNLINSDGLYTEPKYNIENSFVLHDSIFDNDALIIENSEVNEISLIDNNKKYLTVKFDAPLFGIWSPAKKNAPFVCIEPWYGRCDSEDFEGDITEREWSNSLDVGKTWYKEYEIIINE